MSLAPLVSCRSTRLVPTYWLHLIGLFSRVAYFLALSSKQEPPRTEDSVKPIPTLEVLFCYSYDSHYPSSPAISLHRHARGTNVATACVLWLVNTGWRGGEFGTGKRCKLPYTCCIVNATQGPDDILAYECMAEEASMHYLAVTLLHELTFT